MNARKITVVSTKTQSKKVFMSESETVKDLIKEIEANGITTEYMDIYEGVSRTKLHYNDELPKDIQYKDKITNDLVIMLSTTNKKIESGALSKDRAEAYELIKANNLQDEVKKKFKGKNYTQVSTEELLSLIKKDKEVIKKRNDETSEYSDEEISEMFASLFN